LEREKRIHLFEEFWSPISVALIVGNCPNEQPIYTSMNNIHCDQCDHKLIPVWPPLWSITEICLLLACHSTST
jgi:hypothetical protein